jgi:hypothetical protein
MYENLIVNMKFLEEFLKPGFHEIRHQYGDTNRKYKLINVSLII